MADNDKQKKENGLSDYGIIYISGAIDGGTAESVCKEVIEYNIKGEVNQIQMIINSPGGSCPAGFSIIDIMEWSRIPGDRNLLFRGCDNTRQTERPSTPFREISWHFEGEQRTNRGVFDLLTIQSSQPPGTTAV